MAFQATECQAWPGAEVARACRIGLALKLDEPPGQVARLPACLSNSEVASSSHDCFSCLPRRADDEPPVVLQTRALTRRPQSQHARGELPGNGTGKAGVADREIV